jgi:hypothetical protein
MQIFSIDILFVHGSYFISKYPYLLFLGELANVGIGKHFAGAICMHWTTNNTTEQTRVSLDFRLIDGRYYSPQVAMTATTTESNNPNGSNHRPSHQHTPPILTDSYYSVCEKVIVNHNNGLDSTPTTTWKKRDGPRLRPDARMGFPWTVKSWDKILNNRKT